MTVLFVIEIELYVQWFCFGRIIINLFLHEAVDVIAVYLELEGVLWLRQVINQHFCEGMQAVQSDGKGKELVSGVTLLGGDDIFAHCQFAELCVIVQDCWHANVLALAH